MRRAGTRSRPVPRNDRLLRPRDEATTRPGLESEGSLKSLNRERRLVSLSRVTSFAYIRTSTSEQNAALQRDAIAASGIPEKYIYADEGASGSLAN